MELRRSAIIHLIHHVDGLFISSVDAKSVESRVRRPLAVTGMTLTYPAIDLMTLLAKGLMSLNPKLYLEGGFSKRPSRDWVEYFITDHSCVLLEMAFFGPYAPENTQEMFRKLYLEWNGGDEKSAKAEHDAFLTSIWVFYNEYPDPFKRLKILLLWLLNNEGVFEVPQHERSSYTGL